MGNSLDRVRMEQEANDALAQSAKDACAEVKDLTAEVKDLKGEL